MASTRRLAAVAAGAATLVAAPAYALGGGVSGRPTEDLLRELRHTRNSKPVLNNLVRLYEVTEALDKALREAYENEMNATADTCAGGGDVCQAGASAPSTRPGNFHGVKSHAYYVGAISEAHPSLPLAAVHSIVASEWYHPGLTAKAVWCVEDCGKVFPLARRLDANFAAIQREVEAFWAHPDAAAELGGVGTHTTQFDRRIAGNGTWVDVRLWRGRAFHRRLCERHFRVVCGLVEASPEVWSNPWSHVLLSVLLRDSWVPFHQGHTNGQLTYHLPVSLPLRGGSAELAVVDRGGTLPEDRSEKPAMLAHPEERTVEWRHGRTLVFDDSFTHAVRFRSLPDVDINPSDQARVVLLMRAWHPELPPEEREAIREFVRRGGEEEPAGYEMLPISSSVFAM